jgi:hypothetical protein
MAQNRQKRVKRKSFERKERFTGFLAGDFPVFPAAFAAGFVAGEAVDDAGLGREDRTVGSEARLEAGLSSSLKRAPRCLNKSIIPIG